MADSYRRHAAVPRLWRDLHNQDCGRIARSVQPAESAPSRDMPRRARPLAGNSPSGTASRSPISWNRA